MKLFNHLYSVLGADAELQNLGIKTSDFTRQFGAEMKDPPLPRLSFSIDHDGRQVFANVDYVKLYVNTYAKTAKTAEGISERVSTILHRYKAATDDIIVHSCFAMGGPPQPMFVKETNTWEVALVFQIRFV